MPPVVQLRAVSVVAFRREGADQHRYSFSLAWFRAPAAESNKFVIGRRKCAGGTSFSCRPIARCRTSQLVRYALLRFNPNISPALGTVTVGRSRQLDRQETSLRGVWRGGGERRGPLRVSRSKQHTHSCALGEPERRSASHGSAPVSSTDGWSIASKRSLWPAFLAKTSVAYLSFRCSVLNFVSSKVCTRGVPQRGMLLRLSGSERTFQASELVCVGWGTVNPGGVNSATTSRIWRPPSLITNTVCMTPCGGGVLGTFKLITILPVQSGFTV